MAEFLTAFKLTGHAEGGYSFNPSDRGRETYAGVSRKNWPNWEGWQHIDTIKENYGTSSTIINKWASKDIVLQSLILSFYKQNFWDINKLDQINDQQIANAVYDFGVNAGVRESAKVLQASIAYIYPKDGLTADGIIGNQTTNACNNGVAYLIYAEFSGRRRAHYNKLAQEPGQHQFLASWLSRIKPYQIA